MSPDITQNFLLPSPYDVGWTELVAAREAFNSSPLNFDEAPVPANATIGILTPINATTPTQTAVLPQNLRRGWLIIQNNSASGGPTLYVNFDGPVPGILPASQVLTFPPQTYLVLDRHVPYNALYVAFAGGSGAANGVGVIAQGLMPYRRRMISA